MKPLAYALFAVVVTVAAARVILSRHARMWSGWTHDELDARSRAAGTA